MSVLIKGMDMPRHCDECFFYTEKSGGICRVSYEGRCPLVEVPTPHGRLIDADKLEYITVPIAPIFSGDSEHYESVVFTKDINKAQTIIEAEE